MNLGNVLNRCLIAAVLTCTGAVTLMAGSPVMPSRRSFSGPVADRNNPLGVQGAHRRTVDFAPDGKVVAYLWTDADFMYPTEFAASPRTLAQKISLRVRQVDGTVRELKIPLDSIDLRPGGIPCFSLGAGVQAAPDSKHILAIVARRIVVVDVSSSDHRSIEYPGEFFGSSAWVGTNEIGFSTTDGKAITYWRYNIDSATRVRIYTEPAQEILQTNTPPSLRQDQWSPDGRFVTFNSFLNAPKGQSALLDFDSQAIHTFPFSLVYQCWKPDSTALFVNDRFASGGSFHLINPVTGKSEDLTPQFGKVIGRNMEVTFVSPVWTPDGKQIVLYAADELSTPVETGYVVKLDPFEVVLSREQILRWSPIPNWFLLQGEKRFKWIDSSGKRTASIKGWVNDWTWSIDGRLAAQVYDGQVHVFKPGLPPGIKWEQLATRATQPGKTDSEADRRVTVR